MSYQYIQTESLTDRRVGVIRINRPKELNALNRSVIEEIIAALQGFEADADIGAVVLTGNERAFAAGADIKEMAEATAVDMNNRDQFSRWDMIKRFKKPLIAAVSGFALGGGCELAMLCDMIVASDTAQFGQPEIKLGVIPGAGGTQRLTRAVGKALAMELILTGRFMTAEEAQAHGLINRIVPQELYLEEALKLAATIAAMPPVAVQMAKESVLQAHETHLQQGLLVERKNFYLLFATEDQKEGMSAFIEKRTPQWKGQ